MNLEILPIAQSRDASESSEWIIKFPVALPLVFESDARPTEILSGYCSNLDVSMDVGCSFTFWSFTNTNPTRDFSFLTAPEAVVVKFAFLCGSACPATDATCCDDGNTCTVDILTRPGPLSRGLPFLCKFFGTATSSC